MTYPTDGQLKTFFEGLDKLIADVLAATEAAKWLPIEQAPQDDDIDLIGLFETPAGRFVSGCWRYEGKWWWAHQNIAWICDSWPVKFQYLPEPMKGDA